MKFIYFLLLISFVSVQAKPQSLSIDQTIDYLNKFSKEQPYSIRPIYGFFEECDYSGYYEFAINREGLLSIYVLGTKTNCKQNSKTYTNLKVLAGKFYIQDINLEEIKYDNSFLENDVIVQCRFKDRCITQTKSRLGLARSQLMEDSLINPDDIYKTTFLYITTTDRYNRNKLYNAIVYLLTSAIEKGYIRNDVGDPFANKEDKKVAKSEIKKDSTSKLSVKPKTTLNTESKIALKKEGGVFSLNANVNGLIAKFILDSGAGDCSISLETENRLIANGTITKKDYLNNGLYRMADGSIVENRRVKISKLVIGKKTVYNIVASVGPTGSPNLLGQSFLSKLNYWSIDNSKEVLILK